MSSSMWYVQLRFSTYQRGRWVTLACDLRPENARREAAALYRGARTDAGEYPIEEKDLVVPEASGPLTGERLARAERSVELALTA